jgi:hypothetical protein
MGFVAPVAAVAPFPGNGRDPGERQKRIAQVRRLIEAGGFVPKDFFYTQPSAPEQPPAPPKDDEVAYAEWQTAHARWQAAYVEWQARERRRKPIAQRMMLWGLTTHDLAPSK